MGVTVATTMFLQATMLAVVFAYFQPPNLYPDLPIRTEVVAEDPNPAGLELFRLRHEHNMAACMAMLQNADKEGGAMFGTDFGGPPAKNPDSLASAVLESCMLGLELMQDLPRIADSDQLDVSKRAVGKITDLQKMLKGEDISSESLEEICSIE